MTILLGCALGNYSPSFTKNIFTTYSVEVAAKDIGKEVAKRRFEWELKPSQQWNNFCRNWLDTQCQSPMRQANHNDRERIVDILSASFNDNRSVNYIIKQDGKRADRLKGLMRYSFDVCQLFGDVFLTNDKSGCALILKPDRKKTTLQSLLLDAKLAAGVLGIENIKKASARETTISKTHPKGLLYYLWFIGVDPGEQNKGIGSELLQKVIEEGEKDNRIICLETSTEKNIPWYKKFGFTIYQELDFGYRLYCMKK